jgi:hypothetical protein
VHTPSSYEYAILGEQGADLTLKNLTVGNIFSYPKSIIEKGLASGVFKPA